MKRRKVPVLLTEDMKAAIIALNKTREDGKVSKSNEFIFAVNDGRSTNSLRGHDVLKKACRKVKLQQPDLVKSTNLRKYVAIVSQLVDMNESEMGWLANHLGHDIHVHKEFYRLPQSTLEMAVVGNLLMAVDEGRAHHFKGKNPRDIKLAGNNNYSIVCAGKVVFFPNQSFAELLESKICLISFKFYVPNLFSLSLNESKAIHVLCCAPGAVLQSRAFFKDFPVGGGIF